MVNKKRKAREIGFQILFQKDFENSRDHYNFDVDQVLSQQFSNEKLDSESKKYVEKIVEGVKLHLNEIVEIMKINCKNWKVDRMPRMDKIIMQIAIFELLYLNPPLSRAIVINEAIELAKKYSTTESKMFLNGVLDTISKNTRVD